jgi:CheY-like chemotaxis protein
LTGPQAGVLVTDDCPEMRGMLADYLAGHGWFVRTAADGVEAVDLALRVHPAVVIMDLQMPRMDGWAATQNLKSNPRTSDIRILIVAECTLLDSERLAWQAGCDEILRKPVDFDRLDDILSRWFVTD